MKSYLITDPAYYGNDAARLEESLEAAYRRHSVDVALFRDKQTSIYPDLARIFIDVSRRHNIGKTILHGDPLLAHQFGADGVHLTSHQHMTIHEAKSLGLYVIISTHTHLEAMIAEQAGADAITYSPIFPSPDKGEPKGLEDLKEIVAKINIPIFALGGITTEDQKQAVAECGVYGFASIRYFTDNSI